MENTIKMGDLGVPLFPETSQMNITEMKTEVSMLAKNMVPVLRQKSYDSTKKNYMIMPIDVGETPYCFTVFSSTSSCRKCAMWPWKAGASDEVHYEVWLAAKALGNLNVAECKTGWWFGTCFIFPYIGNNHPNWLIFFRGVAQPPTRKRMAQSGAPVR